MPGPLAGLRIVDLTAVVAGPLATALLADQGADVIKVERPSGDIQRHVGSARGGMSGNFHVLNRGKRSIAVDLKEERGRAIVERLASTADALVQNYRPGVLDRLGLGWSRLSARNPRLVYVSMSGFGPDGPHAGRRAYDPIIQARSGLAAAQGRARGEAPEQIHQLLCDKVTAYVASQALTAALFARERSGRGQHVTVSMLDAAITFLWPDAGADSILLGDGIDHRPPIGSAGYLTRFRDGWATVMALSDAEWQGLCGALDLDALATDPRFATIAARQRHRDELRAALDAQVAPRALELTLAEAEARFDAAHVPFGRVNGVDELAADPQVVASQVLIESDHPVAGRVREARPAPRFGTTPARAGGPAPLIGEHTRAILTELGMAGEILELLAAGVVSEPPAGAPGDRTAAPS
jgi:crotonobetainyl-CoA:carnitine CoA-transferase CaiB-like acyl-CoA transferase